MNESIAVHLVEKFGLNEPTVLLQFTGQPLITATNYEQEVLRCAKCQKRYEAPLPDGVNEERYDATCDATIALMRYGGGLPWYRQAGLQAMGGVPLSEATMWERCEATADAGLGVFQELMRQAANGELMHTDDTWVRMWPSPRKSRYSRWTANDSRRNCSARSYRAISIYACPVLLSALPSPYR